jgi:hypothetical protein
MRKIEKNKGAKTATKRVSEVVASEVHSNDARVALVVGRVTGESDQATSGARRGEGKTDQGTRGAGRGATKMNQGESGAGTGSDGVSEVRSEAR